MGMLWNIQPTTIVGWFLVRKVGFWCFLQKWFFSEKCPFDAVWAFWSSLHQLFGWCVYHLENFVQDDPCEGVEQCPDFFWHLKRWSPDFVGNFLLKLLRFGAKSNPVSAESVEAGFMLANIAPFEGWMVGDSVVQQKCKHTSTSKWQRMEITTTSRDKNGYGDLSQWSTDFEWWCPGFPQAENSVISTSNSQDAAKAASAHSFVKSRHHTGRVVCKTCKTQHPSKQKSKPSKFYVVY